MSFAPNSEMTKLLGRFIEKDVGNTFEYSLDEDFTYDHYPHKVWVTSPIEGIDSGYRYANVKKTVCYIMVDEDENGPVLERWFLKKNTEYDNLQH